MEQFLAHISEDGRVQTLAEHLHGTPGFAKRSQPNFRQGGRAG